jgi:hypothetical protein
MDAGDERTRCEAFFRPGDVHNATCRAPGAALQKGGLRPVTRMLELRPLLCGPTDGNIHFTAEPWPSGVFAEGPRDLRTGTNRR